MVRPRVKTGLNVWTLCLFDRVECPRGVTGAGQDKPEGRSAYLLYAGTVPSVLERKLQPEEAAVRGESLMKVTGRAGIAGENHQMDSAAD